MKQLMSELEHIISIHALVKRATYKLTDAGMQFRISIHALVKRATVILGVSKETIEHFNPRPRKEGDVSRLPLALRFPLISIHALVKRATVIKA